MTKEITNKPNKETIQAWAQLHRAHRVLLEKAELSLKNNSLPMLSWYDVLLELYEAKEHGLRQYEIGERILLNKHNLSRLIDRLENKQLVSRRVCTEDGRGYRIKITSEGKKVLKRVWPVYSQSIQENFGSKLNSTELVELSKILGKVLAESGGT